MNHIASAGTQILDRTREINYASYLVDSDSIDITFTHSMSWDLNEIRGVEWETFASQFPKHSELPELTGKGTLKWNATTETWENLEDEAHNVNE